MGRVDNIYILNIYILNDAGISVERLHITEMKKAKERAKELTEYHNRSFSVIVKNEYVNKDGFGFQAKPSEVQNKIGKS